jgi:hypothetical protein
VTSWLNPLPGAPVDALRPVAIELSRPVIGRIAAATLRSHVGASRIASGIDLSLHEIPRADCRSTSGHAAMRRVRLVMEPGHADMKVQHPDIELKHPEIGRQRPEIELQRPEIELQRPDNG